MSCTGKGRQVRPERDGVHRRRQHDQLLHFGIDDVEAGLDWAQQRVVAPHRNRSEKPRALRDYAFLLLLADTGLRVAEACAPIHPSSSAAWPSRATRDRAFPRDLSDSSRVPFAFLSIQA